MIPIFDSVFIVLLAVWFVLSVLRFIHMYDLTSPFQRWRKWDWFRLVPVGAFFSPRPPQTELWIVVRDFLPDGSVTKWTEVPQIQSRAWWHALWNPQKHFYRAKHHWARALLSTAEQFPEVAGHFPVQFLLTDPYLAVLRYVVNVQRLDRPRATQFAVIETEVLTNKVLRTVLSSVHEV